MLDLVRPQVDRRERIVGVGEGEVVDEESKREEEEEEVGSCCRSS